MSQPVLCVIHTNKSGCIQLLGQCMQRLYFMFQMDWNRTLPYYKIYTLLLLQALLRAERFASSEKLGRLSWKWK